MDLNRILESFGKGEIDKDRAKELIHTVYNKVRSKVTDEGGQKSPSEDHDNDDSARFKDALHKLKKSRNLDDLLKASSGIVHQIAENVPGQIEKIRENVLQDLSFVGVAGNMKGISSKLSVFRSFEVSGDSQVENNQAVGSQWFGVSFSRKAEVLNNKFTAVQFSEVSVIQSDFSSNVFALSRLSNLTFQESRIESNRVSRGTLSDVSLTESDFTENHLVKSEFAQTVINGSRLAKNTFDGVLFKDCEFDSCDLQGLVFENCRFEECSFSRLEIAVEEPVKISNKTFVGRTFQDCVSLEAFLTALDTEDATEDSGEAEAVEPEEENGESSSDVFDEEAEAARMKPEQEEVRARKSKHHARGEQNLPHDESAPSKGSSQGRFRSSSSSPRRIR